MCCGSVQHIQCSSCREGFKAKFKELIGDSFEQLSDIDKTAYNVCSRYIVSSGRRILKTRLD